MSKEMTRRDFLRLAALGIGGTLVGGCASPEPEKPVLPTRLLLYNIRQHFGNTVVLVNSDGSELSYPGVTDTYRHPWSVNGDFAARAYNTLVILDQKGVQKAYVGEVSATTVAWSPDGTKLYYDSYVNPGKTSGIFEFDLKAKTLKPVIKKGSSRSYSPSISPDGKRMIFLQAKVGDLSVGTVYENPILIELNENNFPYDMENYSPNTKGEKALFTAGPLVEYYNGARRGHFLRWINNNTIIYVPNSNEPQLTEINVETGETKTFSGIVTSGVDIDLSPNGKLIIYADKGKIKVFDREAGNYIDLTGLPDKYHDLKECSSPRWLSNSKFVCIGWGHYADAGNDVVFGDLQKKEITLGIPDGMMSSFYMVKGRGPLAEVSPFAK